MTFIAAVLVSKSDFDWVERLGKPCMACTRSRTEVSHERKATAEESLPDGGRSHSHW